MEECSTLLKREWEHNFFQKKKLDIWFFVKESWTRDFLPYSTKRWVLGIQWAREIKTLADKKQSSKEIDNYIKYKVLKWDFDESLEGGIFFGKAFSLATKP